MILEFFIALVGVAYFATKIGCEKERANEIKLLDQEHEVAKSAWMERWTNKDIEQQLVDYISDYRNYKEIAKEVSVAIDSIPGLRSYVVFGDEWYESGIYAAYWKNHGLTLKKAHKQANYVRKPIFDIMLTSRGCVPSSWSSTFAGSFGCTPPAPIDIEVFKWCVKNLRSAYQMQDPVVRVEHGTESLTPGWSYTIKPLFYEGCCSEVSDDEIVMMPK